MSDDKKIELKMSINLLPRYADATAWAKTRWQFMAALLYNNYLEALDEIKMANLPDDKELSTGNNTDKKRAVKKNQDCMDILMTSFINNLSMLLCAVETIDPPILHVEQSHLTMKVVNKMFMPGGIIGNLNCDEKIDKINISIKQKSKCYV